MSCCRLTPFHGCQSFHLLVEFLSDSHSFEFPFFHMISNGFEAAELPATTTYKDLTAKTAFGAKKTKKSRKNLYIVEII